jgi:Ala-tRNA(Pro) deacylase
VTVILDADMMRQERLNYHPLENSATTNIAGEDLLRFIRACGHTPRILAVAAEENGAEERH